MADSVNTALNYFSIYYFSTDDNTAFPSSEIQVSQQTFAGLEDVLKTSWRHVLKTSSTRFSVTILGLPRSLEDVLQRLLEDVLKTSCKSSWRRLKKILEDDKLLRWLKRSSRRLEDVLKTCYEDVLNRCFEEMSWRCLEDISWRLLGDIREKQNAYWWYLYLTNLNVYLTNVYFKNLYLTILR